MRALLTALLLLMPLAASAQDPLTIATVTRAPFSMENNGRDTGFAIELWEMVAKDLGLEYTYQRANSFGGMLDLVTSGAADGAIANIPVTAEREAKMDFTKPIFDSGLQIMVPNDEQGSALLSALVTRDIALSLLAAAALLFGGGMLMWVFERGRAGYFDRPARDAMFPAFWWALNLVVNGGFEERIPQSRPGRFFAVVLVVGSLFVVSIFVAQITATMTVTALQNSVESLSDLEGKRVGSIATSFPENWLKEREGELGYKSYSSYDTTANMLTDLRSGRIEAAVNDIVSLRYAFAQPQMDMLQVSAEIPTGDKFAIMLPKDSEHLQAFNDAISAMKEDGTMASLYEKWLGVAPAAGSVTVKPLPIPTSAD